MQNVSISQALFIVYNLIFSIATLNLPTFWKHQPFFWEKSRTCARLNCPEKGGWFGQMFEANLSSFLKISWPPFSNKLTTFWSNVKMIVHKNEHLSWRRKTSLIENTKTRKCIIVDRIGHFSFTSHSQLIKRRIPLRFSLYWFFPNNLRIWFFCFAHWIF
jgi:hypothetical protein